MATIKGERQEIKPGFYSITRETTNGKLIAFYNETTDTQFNICYTFTDPRVAVLGRTQSGGEGKYAAAVYPGETVEFVDGKWKGYKRSLSYGAPDKEWQEKQAAKRDQKIEEEIADLKALVKQHPKADGKYTAEYIADLCVKHGVRFVDLTFPPKASSLARDWEPQVGEFNWMRPDQYCPKDQAAQVFVGDIEPNDIAQGALGDCYLCCAIACIAEFPQLVRDCFSLEQHPQLGIYRVLVCKNGWWQVVVVDDFLPVRNGHPCFAHNRTEPNELWVSLLEKAYAKLHGSYAAIKSGDAAQAIADILGAPYRKLKQMPEWSDKTQLFKLLKRADEEDDLMSIGTPGGLGTDPPLTGEKRVEMARQYEDVGLAIDHAYSLLRVKEPQGHKLCMIRNPWGDNKEWNGDWSDDSSLWTPELQREVGFYRGEDGTFWMCWDDVVKYFDNGSVSSVLRDWPQLRVTANFDGICSDLVVLLQVSKKVEVHFGCHQRDSRGLPSGDKDRQYIGMLLSVLLENDAGTGSAKVVETTNGSYSTTRDNYAFVELQPSAKPYAVLVQPYQDAVKSFVISIVASDPTAFDRVMFRSCAEKRKYLPPTKFRLADWGQKAVANFQLRTARTGGDGMVVHAAAADSVDIKSLVPTVATAKPPAAAANILTKGSTDTTPAKHVDPAAASPAGGGVTKQSLKTDSQQPPQKQQQQQPATSAPARKAPAVRGLVKLQMIVLSGRNLVAKDSNGLSDPYVTVKLKNAQGVHLQNDQRKETRYIQETLNPVWCEVLNFQCSPEDVLCIKCWDKDLFGHDAMGVLNVPIAEAIDGLSAGGSAKIGWYKLEPPPSDASGELQLAFTWML